MYLGSIISLTASLITESASKALWELLRERLNTAREEYKAKPLDELTPALERNRRACLDALSELQTRAILEMLDTNLLQRVLALSLELTAGAYEAHVEQDLDAIRRRIEQLKSFLDREEKDRRHRSQVRVVAVLISVISFVGLFALAILAPRFGLESSYVIPILQIPLAVLFWSAIGSFVSLLYRFNKASDLELQDPLRWLITRPLTGIVMGAVVYLIVRTGFLSAGAGELLTTETNELVWLMAFLVGFSDRFAEGLLKSLVGQLGGERDAGLFASLGSPSELNLVELLQPLYQIEERDKVERPESGNGELQQESEELTEEVVADPDDKQQLVEESEKLGTEPKIEEKLDSAD